MNHKTRLILLRCALFITLFFTASATHADHAGVGVVKIDGEIIPAEHFPLYEYNFQPKYKNCSAESARNGLIDRHVLKRIIEKRGIDIDTKGVLRNRQKLIDELNNLPEDYTHERGIIEIELLVGSRLLAAEALGLIENTGAQKFKEYNERVKLKDPALVNFPVYRVKNIGPIRDDEILLEAAKLLDSGVPFDEVAASYEKFHIEKHKPNPGLNTWLTREAIEHYKGDSSKFEVDYVIGLEELLEDNDSVWHLTKIIDKKIIPQVRSTDQLAFEWGNWRGASYVFHYLRERVHTWKYPMLMSELWSEFTITENGLPIKRFGSESGCDLYF